MAEKQKDWVEYSYLMMLERLRRGTDRTNELLRRSQERIRISLDLLGRSKQSEETE
ncbi:hypothetical protein [Bradyrhizobium pachyrhizi]|uniref:hypothetical protein n=1 Tax=Bradyrhizobium pachyrhizi TaxID=280333 RepID=UPI000A6EBD46|nr:hypothetical protein [Bradyrhizobium pachyrhizi]